MSVPWWGVNLHGRVDLAWAACGGAVTYRVYRASVPITAIDASVTLLGETSNTSTAWAEDLAPGEYYYAIGAVNEFAETLSAPARVLVVALIPGLPPLAGLVIVVVAAGVLGASLVIRWRRHRTRKGTATNSGEV